MNLLLRSALAAVFTYTNHYILTKGYSYFCVPDGIYGFFHGLLSLGSPVCQTVMSLMSNTQITYATILLTSFSRLLVDILAGANQKIEYKEADQHEQ